MKLVLLGAPGSGKGTQAERLSQDNSLMHVSTGDLFRQAEKDGTELGKKAKSYVEKGLLVPDEIVINMVLERIAGKNADFILDGFPRTIEQAKALDQALADGGVDWAIYINVSREELIRRLTGRWICRQCQRPYHVVSSPPKVSGKCDSCGGELYQRPDDTRETVEKRLEVYFKETAPLVDYYRNRDKLLEIDGEKSIDEVAQELKARLDLKSDGNSNQDSR